MDPHLRLLAERRLLAALRGLHRKEPMQPDFRADTVLHAVRADPGESRPAGHRGGGSLAALGDAALLDVVDGLVERRAVARRGRRLRLGGHEPRIQEPEMRGRVEQLLAGLSSAGAAPPRVEAVASRLGIPPPVIHGLRASGALVQIADGIDYPADVLAGFETRINTLAQRHTVTVAAVRDELGTSRRHAEALIAFLRRRPTRAGNATP